jgi:hypothetical protein
LIGKPFLSGLETQFQAISKPFSKIPEMGVVLLTDLPKKKTKKLNQRNCS